MPVTAISAAKLHTIQAHMDRHMRSFIRHPSSIQILYRVDNSQARGEDRMNNVSTGGISFRSNHYLEPDVPITIEIPCVKPGMLLPGRVIWCRKVEEYHDVGVQFTDQEDEFRIRMIEQLCYIEHYRQSEEKKGRTLSPEEAAHEWIEKYAGDFPALR